jgi:hypothetical protein
MTFEITGEITDIETIAAGTSIREMARLRRQYGQGRWRKIMSANDQLAVANRVRLDEARVFALNVMASPGGPPCTRCARP